MKPYYEHGGITIFHGDCREILPFIHTDLAITSPPYNIGAVHHNNNSKHSPYPDDMPEAEYQAWQVDVLQALFASTSAVFYNHKNRIREGCEISPRDWIRQSTWKVRQTLVWVNGGPNHDPIRFFPKTERIFWLVKDSTPPAENREWWDVLEFSPDAVSLSGQGHTRSFPLALATVLASVCPWAETLCDPFCGSGTTLVAAKDIGRRAIGIEIEERYCEIAAQRLSQEVLAL